MGQSGPSAGSVYRFFIKYMQKTVHFYTLFQNTLLPSDSGKTEQYPSGYKTLMYAIGRQNREFLGGSTVAGNRMAGMGVTQGVPDPVFFGGYLRET
jgi:hypothetical protein